MKRVLHVWIATHTWSECQLRKPNLHTISDLITVMAAIIDSAAINLAQMNQWVQRKVRGVPSRALKVRSNSPAFCRIASEQPFANALPRHLQPEQRWECNTLENIIKPISLPTVYVSPNRPNHLPVDALIDSVACQGNYASEELAEWIEQQGCVREISNSVISFVP